eukprot:2703209-Alexandrium_andersonii.AAC.1
MPRSRVPEVPVEGAQGDGSPPRAPRWVKGRPPVGHGIDVCAKGMLRRTTGLRQGTMVHDGILRATQENPGNPG